jgi:hypothetical protein
MPACKNLEAELERRQKISAAFKGKPRGPGKAWNVEAREREKAT